MTFGEKIVAAATQDRDVWWPEWQTEIVSTLGRDWPDIIVQKWERNYIGERRWVDTVIYSRPES